jgi:hypothetical protein
VARYHAGNVMQNERRTSHCNSRRALTMAGQNAGWSVSMSISSSIRGRPRAQEMMLSPWVCMSERDRRIEQVTVRNSPL